MLDDVFAKFFYIFIIVNIDFKSLLFLNFRDLNKIKEIFLALLVFFFFNYYLNTALISANYFHFH